MSEVREVGEWYVAELIMEITVRGATRNAIHLNLVLVKALSPEEAYEKAVRFGQEAETSYDNPLGQPVEIRFRGVARLDEAVDGGGQPKHFAGRAAQSCRHPADEYDQPHCPPQR